ncbi:hypothetical protein PPYR_05562 [Photinus pyralis]|uniref:Partial AB-hydrolase lipase domain-containing protein n=1 Tax=Photinus pyralis TaxID=7054 RepID=A0A5N4AVF3_PHOPY|nr:lipase 3-like [Photinus pyralis]KAB0801208.1 hypothetical protein PPYR_05562 [Photinus pyralis]
MHPLNILLVFMIIIVHSKSQIPVLIPHLPSLPPLPTIPRLSDLAFLQNVDYDITAIFQKVQTFYKSLPSTVKEDALLAVSELVRKYGYPCESHSVTSSDGYILTLHRIPSSKNHQRDKLKPAVFVQHGILSSSADWLIPGPGKALGYLLSDAGFDVWLGNVRGNRYSRKHVWLNTKEPKFWDFSFHEIAVYDLPAMIDYILNQTNQENLTYIGHSQGTTVFYVLCSEKPEYNDKINMQLSLSPVGYMNHLLSPLMHVLARGEVPLGILASLIGMNEFLPNTKFLAVASHYLCSDISVTQILCSNSYFAMCGFNQRQMNSTLLPVIMAHNPAGASTKQFLHYAQEIKSGKFRQYDYGSVENRQKYNRSVPPDYKLENIVAPTYLYYSRNDWLSSEIDVNRLAARLGNLRGKFLVSDPKLNHVDYLYSINAPEVLYKPMLMLMKSSGLVDL